VVSHVEEVRMRTRKRIVLMCPDHAAYTASLLLTSLKGRERFGDVQSFFFPHTGNRATLTNGYYMLVAAGHYIRHVLADDCRVQLGRPPFLLSPNNTDEATAMRDQARAAVMERMGAVKVFVFDPVRTILCSNPFRSISRHRLTIVPVPVESSPFYASHFALLSKAWRDDYSGVGMRPSPTSLPRSNGDDDAQVRTNDESSNSNRNGNVAARHTPTTTVPQQRGFAVSSSAIGGGARMVAEVSYLLQRAALEFQSSQNFATIDDRGPHCSKLALGLEPLLTNVTTQWLQAPHSNHVGTATRQLEVMRSFHYTSTTYCPQFQEPARFCRRYAEGTRPDIVMDYHHCNPRAPSPLTNHILLPEALRNQSHAVMLDAMCLSLFPHDMIRVAPGAYLAAAMEVTPSRYTDVWRSWQSSVSRRTLPPATATRRDAVTLDPSTIGLPPRSNISECGGAAQLHVVVTVAADYHAEKVKWLLRTYDRHHATEHEGGGRGGGSCSVMVLLITRHYKEYRQAIEGRRGIYLFRLHHYLSTVPKGTLKLFQCPMVLARIELLRYVLQHEILPKWNPHYVLVVDARDTFFQSNPFDALSRLEADARSQGHLLPTHTDFVVLPAMSYGWGHMELRVPQRYLINREWSTSLFPDALFDAMRSVRLHWEDPAVPSVPPTRPQVPAFNLSTGYQAFPALCGGMYFGTARAMLDFFDLFVKTAIAAPDRCRANDQGLLLGLVPFGIAVAQFPHPVLILDPMRSQFTNEPDYGMSVRSDAAAAVTLNCRGEPFAVLHQFLPKWHGVVAQVKKQLASAKKGPFRSPTSKP
jgi:hypothetical protein